MPDHTYIYNHQAELYERLVSRQPSLLDEVNAIRPVNGLDIVDAGAGTGRLAAVLAPYARTITAMDASPSMLEITAGKLRGLGLPGEGDSWSCIPADNRSLPLPDASCDLLVSGWSVCYLASSNAPGWKGNLEAVLAEFHRVTRPGGSVILFETMGTGTAEPSPPDFLIGYYRLLEEEYGFSHKIIRLDYSFQDWREAELCVRHFFGDELGDRIRQEHSRVLKEYAGVWWLTRK